MLVKKYSIGEVAEMCSVSIKTLRYYDQIGLVIPEFRNEESKYRYYSKKQMIKLFIIRQLRKLASASRRSSVCLRISMWRRWRTRSTTGWKPSTRR